MTTQLAAEIAQNIIDLEMDIKYFPDNTIEKITHDGIDYTDVMTNLFGFDNYLDVIAQLKKYPLQESNEDRGDILQENRKEEKHYGC